MITEEEFKRIADVVNNTVRGVALDLLQENLGDDGMNGARIVAMIAGMISASGVCCGMLEPDIDGDKLASVMRDQFDAGRADGRQMSGKTAH